MSTDLSVIMPSIRTHHQVRVYESLRKSCQKYKFELVLCGPFEPPAELKSKNNVIWLQSYMRPSACGQFCLTQARGKYIFLSTDDGVFEENTIDEALDLIQDKNVNDFVVMRYREGNNSQALETWNANFYGEFQRSPHIGKDWKIAVQFLCTGQTFVDLGGFNCKYEYLNGGAHDFIFRLQSISGKGYLSPREIANFDHMPERTGDHGPIHDCCTTTDKELFEQLWYGDKPPHPMIDFYNFLDFQEDWPRRFAQRYNSYEEMMRLKPGDKA